MPIFRNTRNGLVAAVLIATGLVACLYVSARSFRSHLVGKTPTWITELKDEDPEVRRRAAVMLGEYGAKTPEALAALVDTMDDEDYFVRAAAAYAIGWFGTLARDAVPILLSALAKGVGHEPANAAFALGEIGDNSPEVIAALTEASRDRDLYLSQRATQALAGLTLAVSSR